MWLKKLRGLFSVPCSRRGTDEQLVGLRHCFCKGIRCWYVLGMLYVFMGRA